MRADPNAVGCGTLTFPVLRERVEESDGQPGSGQHTAAVHYTLPFEPEGPRGMRRKIIMQLAPSAARYI